MTQFAELTTAAHELNISPRRALASTTGDDFTLYKPAGFVLRWYALIPGVTPCSDMPPQVAAEVARLQMPTELLKQLVDLVSRGLDYYPSKPPDALTKP